MGPIESLGEHLVADLLRETIDEMSGRSTRKWAVILVAVLAGAIAAGVIARRSKRVVATETETFASTTA